MDFSLWCFHFFFLFLLLLLFVSLRFVVLCWFSPHFFLFCFYFRKFRLARCVCVEFTYLFTVKFIRTPLCTPRVFLNIYRRETESFVRHSSLVCICVCVGRMLLCVCVSSIALLCHQMKDIKKKTFFLVEAHTCIWSDYRIYYVQTGTHIFIRFKFRGPRRRWKTFSYENSCMHNFCCCLLLLCAAREWTSASEYVSEWVS